VPHIRDEWVHQANTSTHGRITWWMVTRCLLFTVQLRWKSTRNIGGSSEPRLRKLMQTLSTHSRPRPRSSGVNMGWHKGTEDRAWIKQENAKGCQTFDDRRPASGHGQSSTTPSSPALNSLPAAAAPGARHISLLRLLSGYSLAQDDDATGP